MPTPTPTSLDAIREQYDPVWAALRQRGAVEAYEQTRERFRHTLHRFCELLEMAPPPGSILELACGTGIAAVELARRGYCVTGLDCSGEALAVARMLADHAGVDVRWLQADMRSFELNGAMDYVLLWDVVFGIFASEDEDARVLDRISRVLRPGGRSLFQFYDKTFAMQHGIEEHYVYDPELDLFVSGEDGNTLPVKQIRLYTTAEWSRMLGRAGLRRVRSESLRLPGDPQDGTARVRFLVAEKA